MSDREQTEKTLRWCQNDLARTQALNAELVAVLDDTMPAMRDSYESHNGSKRTGCLCAYCDRYRRVTSLLAKSRGES